MTKVVSVAFVLMLALSMSLRAQTGASAVLRKCVGALNAFDGLVASGRSSVGRDWIKGTRGWLLLNSSLPEKRESELRAFVGNAKDISSCAGSGVSPESIQLFLMAFHGYLSADPLEDVSRCYAALMVAAPEMDRTLGRQRAQAFGTALGKNIGAAVVQIGYIWPAKKRTLQQVEARATVISASLAALPAGRKGPAVQTYLSQCGLYNIPLAAVLDGAGVSIK